MAKKDEEYVADIAKSIEKSVEGVDDLFRMKLYYYMLVGGIILSVLLFFTRAAALGVGTPGYYFHLVFMVSVSVFYILALITKKYAPYTSWLLSILMVCATGLYLTSEIGIISPVYHFYTALLVVSMFLVGIKFCTTIYVLINFMYIFFWLKIPALFGFVTDSSFYTDDFYFYISRIGSLAFVFAALLFFHKLKISQHDLIVHIAKIYRDNEKQSVSKQIIAGFAHEINNPLAIINASASQLERNPDRTEIILKIKKSVYRVSGILRVLLKSVEDQSEKYLEHNIDELVQKVMGEDELKNLQGTGIKLKYDIGSKFFANVDEESFSSLVRELLKNAKEAAEGNPEETTIKLSFRHADEGYIFSCWDDAFMSENQNMEVLTRLFYTTKQDRPGRGMGLYVVSSICQKLNWSFSIKRVEETTRAEVIIPRSYIRYKNTGLFNLDSTN